MKQNTQFNGNIFEVDEPENRPDLLDKAKHVKVNLLYFLFFSAFTKQKKN